MIINPYKAYNFFDYDHYIREIEWMRTLETAAPTSAAMTWLHIGFWRYVPLAGGWNIFPLTSDEAIPSYARGTL